MTHSIPMKRDPLVRITRQVLWRPCLLAALLIGSLSVQAVLALDSPAASDEIQALRKRVEELEQRLKSLEVSRAPEPQRNTNSTQRPTDSDQQDKIVEPNREPEREGSATRAKGTPRITVGDNGFGFASADGNFNLQIKGVLQVDSRTFLHDSGTAGNDGILLRRARPVLQGTVFRDFDFLFVPDFGGSSGPQIVDAVPQLPILTMAPSASREVQNSRRARTTPGR